MDSGLRILLMKPELSIYLVKKTIRWNFKVITLLSKLKDTTVENYQNTLKQVQKRK